MTDRIFSTDTDAGTVTVLDAKNGIFTEVEKINVGNGPRGPVVFTKAGRGFLTNHAGSTVSELDPFNNNEVARFKVGSAPLGMGMIPGDQYLLVSNSGDNSISIVSLNTRMEIGTLSVGREPKHMDIHPTKPIAYVCIWGAHVVSKINIEGLINDIPSVEKSLKVEGNTYLGEGAHPYSLKISPNGKYIVVANYQVGYVSIIDEDSGEVI